MEPDDTRETLGVRYGSVALRRHDPAWAAIADREIQAISSALQDLAADIQHVGSTAVPGVLSKPILDIAVALRPGVDAAQVVQALSATGLVSRGDKGTAGGLLFVRTDESDVRTVHVHLVDADSPEWRNYIRFRNILRLDRARREAYEWVKKDAAARFPDDRASYTAAKHVFIEQTLADDREAGGSISAEN